MSLNHGSHPSNRITPRAEKSRMMQKIISFLRERGFHANLTMNELSQPSKQTFMAVWQFLLRQIDVSITLPSTGAEDVIIRVFEQLNYNKDKISKSVLRSFNSPPSWQHTLQLMCTMIDSLYTEEEFLLPTLIPPTNDGNDTIPTAILDRLVTGAETADPHSNVNWREHFQRLRSFEVQWDLFSRAEIDQEELIARQVAWATRQAHEDSLNLKSLDQNIQDAESKLRDLEVANGRLIETRELVIKYRRDLGELRSQLETKCMEENKKLADRTTFDRSVESANLEIERYTKERKALEETIEMQECDREQVTQYQTEIENLKEVIRSIRSDRGAVQQQLRGRKETLSTNLDDLNRHLSKLDSALKTQILPKMRVEDPTKAKAWSQAYGHAKIDRDAALRLVQTGDYEADSDELIDALIHAPLQPLIDAITQMMTDEEQFQVELATSFQSLNEDLQALDDSENKLLQTKQSIDSKHDETKTMFVSVKAKLSEEIEELVSSNTSLGTRISRLDPLLGQEMRSTTEKIQILDVQLEDLRKGHQLAMKKKSDFMKLMEYQRDKRGYRKARHVSEVSTALKELLYLPIQQALTEGNDFHVLYGFIEQEALRVLQTTNVHIA